MQQTTKPQKSAPLPPADPLGARFCQWFSHGWHWIYAETPAPGQKAQWFTETRYPLESRNLWQEYLDPEKIIGLRFNNYETRYCLIDIDRGSPYHLANDRDRFKLLLAALEKTGLPRRLLNYSSDSEGIHIYYYLPEAAPTFDLACAVRFALEDAGLQLRSGQLEIFPNTKAYSPDKPTDYNGHRLPLQAGSYWIDEDGEIISNDLAQYLDAADVAAANQDMATLRKALAAAGKNRRRLRFAPDMSRNAAEWKRHLERRIVEGWTGYHQTNDLLLDFARYGHVFLHLRDDALVDYVVETAKAAPGYEQYCRHQHEIRRRATERSRGADNGYYVPYRGFPKRDRSYRENFEQPQNNIVKLENGANASSRQQAADRIQQAIAHLEATDTLPYGATARAAAIIATVKELTGTGMSLATLHKPCHLPLWHPGQQKSLEPAQGAILHPVLEVKPTLESLEPAQGAILHPTPLYEGLGQDEGQPQPLQGAGKPLIQPLETQTPTAPNGGSGCCCSPGDPSTDDWHNCHTPATPATATAASGWFVPSGADEQTIRRLTRINLDANAYAKKAVKMQQCLENCRFTPADWQRRETAAKMQFFWDSGEPLLMDEVRRWLAKDPTRKLNLSVPAGADSASISHETVTETS